MKIITLISVVSLIPSIYAQPNGPLGERPAIPFHLDQAEIEAGSVTFEELISQGENLFEAQFNLLDGQGRPGLTALGTQRNAETELFQRVLGPDANACHACHSQPRVAGAGDFAANSFEPVAGSAGRFEVLERNAVSLMGVGAIEMLAREMSLELIAIREAARAEARQSGQRVTRRLIAKDVNFGWITVLPNGKIDPRRIEGVDWDLIVKPFGQKGTVVSIRQFVNNSMVKHHGMLPVERFGEGMDPDLDEVVDELTVGDITGLTFFIASLNVPGQVLPRDRARRRAVEEGEALFLSTDCSTCHARPKTLNSRLFTDPNPFNPEGNLQVDQVGRILSFNLTRHGPKPRLQALAGGRAEVAAYTDLKRHNLNDDDFDHFANERHSQGMLNGFAPPSDFTIPPRPRPTGEFLTRRLWDAGSSGPYGHRGDLTTLTEAIYFHGGEARQSRDNFFALSEEDRNKIIEFLKSLRILPNGSNLVVLEDH